LEQQDNATNFRLTKNIDDKILEFVGAKKSCGGGPQIQIFPGKVKNPIKSGFLQIQPSLVLKSDLIEQFTNPSRNDMSSNYL